MENMLEKIKAHPFYKGQIVHIENIPPREPRYGKPAFPLHPLVAGSLRRKGIDRLYSHQAEALDRVRQGKNIVVVTPTASGKSLCYNLPVLDSLAGRSRRTALYMFPTKSLGRDQLEKLTDFGMDLRAGVYDGDTPEGEKAALRNDADIIITNPDMLHRGILPHHLKWHRFFSGLKYVVIDEVHNYRGVFGTNTAHVIRRLKRICRHYGADPAFIFCSATIANPGEHASLIAGAPVEIIDGNGAPRGRTRFVLWRPTVHTPYIRDVSWLLSLCLESRHRTITFSRARQATERILRFTRRHLGDVGPGSRVMAYRGGYLAGERRHIEEALFSGALMGVVSTNALELGIDVGNLEVCIIAGFPGTVASTWQQAGRVGRDGGESLVIFVAVENPLDQHFIRNTGALFTHPGEHALIDPDNPYILTGHAICAAHELPVTAGDYGLWGDSFPPLLSLLEKDGELAFSGGAYHFNGRTYPAERVNIRSGSCSLVHLRDAGRGGRLMEVLDKSAALAEVHPGAVYTHQGSTYIVKSLELETSTALLEKKDVDYYTMCGRDKSTEIISTGRQRKINGHRLYSGQLKVTSSVTGYIKKHEKTGQVLGGGPLEMPEQVLETTGFWLVVDHSAVTRIKNHGLDLMGGLHAVEHAAIGLMPIFAMCDRNDLGGLSTLIHPRTGGATVFIHDSCRGGVGFSEKGYHRAEELFEITLETISSCRCSAGCPACIYSPKCSNFNRPLDKEAAVLLLHLILGRPYIPAALPPAWELGQETMNRFKKSLRAFRRE